MKIKREELVACLKEVYLVAKRHEENSRFILSGGRLEKMAWFRFDKDKLSAFDGWITIVTKLPCNTGLRCQVPSRYFLDMLTNLDNDEIELISKDGNLCVKAGGFSGTIVRRSLSKPIRSLKVPQPSRTYRDPATIANLVEGLNFCKLFASTDHRSGPLYGIMIDEDKLISSDRYRVAWFSLDKKLVGMKCVMYPKMIDIMDKVKDKISHIGYYSKHKTFVVFLKNGTSIISDTIEGEFPPVLNFFPGPKSSFIKVTFNNEIERIMKRHRQFLFGMDRSEWESCLHIQKNKCLMDTRHDSTSQYVGRLTDEFKVRSNVDKELEVFINPHLFDLLKNGTEVKYFPEEKLFTIETGHFQYLSSLREREYEKVLKEE